MTIISIDYSLLYPGVCICHDFKKFEWVAVVNSHITKAHRKNLDDLVIEYPNLEILFTKTKRKTQEQYYLTERVKLINCLEVCSILIENLKTKIKNTDDLLVVLEGMSFGSSGNVKIDIAQATGILKKFIIDNLINGNHEKLFVFSPSELKNAIECKGNASKGEIFAKFKEDPILKAAKKSDLYKAVHKEDWFLDKRDNIVSPIIDMIDSYLGVVKIHKILT